MGEVYRARDSRLDREVAIKVLPHDRLADESRRQRFVQEAKAASALNHPHIVTIHEIESAGDREFIVMEYVRGRSLDAAIPRGGMRLGELLRIAIPVAEALAAAHARGIVHRDLKPANVMIGTDNAVKVLDFGLAKRAGRADGSDETTFTLEADPALSLPGTIVGTAAYMPPEQATGDTVDARSDIFSFGAMLYEMATGARPFGGTSVAETRAAVIQAQPKPPTAVVPGLPRELERLILRCLRKEPDRRYQTIRDVSLELQEIKEESDSGRLSAPVSAARNLPQRGRLIAAAVVAAVALATAVVATIVIVRKPDGPPPRLVPVTALTGLEWQPTLSADGEQVAFQWNGEKQDNNDIYLKLVGSSEWRRLTSDAGDDFAPAWSPDGREIAFLRARQDDSALYAVSPITGAEHKIADLGSGVWGGTSWSADSRWLAVTRRIPGQGGKIHLAPAQGGDLRTLTTTKDPTFPGSPSFSPDGRALAFMTCTQLLRCSLDVLTLDAALEPTGAARTVLKDLIVDKPGIAWTRDGRSLIHTNAGYLWRVPVAGDNPPVRLELAGLGAFSPAVAAHRLAFVFQRDQISQHPLDMTFTSPPVLASSFWDIDVEFSPDGHRLVFASSRAGAGMEIWTARADGTGARQLLHGPGSWQGSPSFSPDGRRVAFDSRQDDGSWSIFVVDGDGGVPRLLTTDVGDEHQPVWSRDGRWIYYTSDQKAVRNVWRISSAGGRGEQLTTSGTGYRVQVSPDGRELLYTPLVPPGRESVTPLLAIPVAGGAPRQVLPCVAAFAANSSGVYYTACGPGPERDVHLVGSAMTRDSVIGRTRDTGFGQMPPAVSPDGKSVLVSRSEWTRDLMMIDNFR
jgi:Tol biopolymer transport system component